MRDGERRDGAFFSRAMRKLREHLDVDPSGWSFVRYASLWSMKKVKYNMMLVKYRGRKIAAETPETVQLAVRVSGGLGDCVVHARVLRDLRAWVGPIEFTVFAPCPEQAEWAFGGVSGVRDVLPEFFADRLRDDFDATLMLNTFAVFDEERIRAARIRRLAPRLLTVIATAEKKRLPWNVFIDHHPTLDGACARQITALGHNRANFIYDLLGIPSGGLGYALPEVAAAAERVAATHPRFVTLNTGFDHLFVISSPRAVKCYPTEYWVELVRRLKTRFPELGVVQLGGRNSVRIPGCDYDFAGRTSLAESAGILRRSALHIDIEGGLVHVCSALGTRCAVLFGPTSLAYFAYPDNLNLQAGPCHDCWWATERWMELCPRRYPRNECMYALTPELALERIAPALEKAE